VNYVVFYDHGARRCRTGSVTRFSLCYRSQPADWRQTSSSERRRGCFFRTCQSADCTIVLDARLPRTLAGLLAGAALGLAGSLMQTLTRNPWPTPAFSA
jgi:ABC-type Fe3+-siderophore transport system permease subunit